MYGDPELWHALMGRLADIAIAFLQVQIDAGASAVQLFDSWVGAVCPEDYRHAILPHTSRIFAALAAVRRAADPLRRGHRRAARPAGRGRRRRGRRRLAYPARRGRPPGRRRHGQGGAGQPRPGRAARAAGTWWSRAPARSSTARAAGHVFNLGHGVLPETDPDVLARLIDLVHEVTARCATALVRLPSSAYPVPLPSPGRNITGPADNGRMRIRIEGTDLPGSTCGPSPQRPEGHHNIHVGVQRRGKPAELLGVVPGDSPGVTWTLDATATRGPGGETDLRGPYLRVRRRQVHLPQLGHHRRARRVPHVPPRQAPARRGAARGAAQRRGTGRPGSPRRPDRRQG